MNSKKITLVTEPIVFPIAEMRLNSGGVLDMADWVQKHRPDCVPETGFNKISHLLPHDCYEGEVPARRPLSDNELLVELSGRKCYDSFAEKAGKKTNKEYIHHTQQGTVPHRSIMYHAKMSFFIAGVSRRVSHELIRNYVGSDRDEEGSPSQESTRFTHHYGWYVAHPRDLNDSYELKTFEMEMQVNYNNYCLYIDGQVEKFKQQHEGKEPKGLDRKRIYESAAQRLCHACETSFIWTTNPMALRKLFLERCDEAADLEFQRLANKWKGVCLERWPNLFDGL